MVLVVCTNVLQAATAIVPPKVSILQPVNGEKFTDPAAIEIIAQAEAANGPVAAVEVLTDLGSLGVIKPNPAAANPVNPLQWTWTNPPAGDHKLMARATDDQGLVTTSDTVVISVVRSSTVSPATLSFVKPTDGAVLPLAESVSIELTAVDPNGDIRHVDFFANDQFIGASDHLSKEATVPGRPIEHYLTWTPAAAGSYELLAKATDTLGNPVQSNPLKVTIGSAPSAAKLVITAPTDGEIFKSGETVSIQATAIDPHGYIAHVDFYDGDAKIGESQLEFFRAPDPGTPIEHHYDWINPPDGGHVLTARATDSQGNPVVSTPVKIQVGGVNPGLPLLSVTVADAEATELPPIVDVIDPARFSITRTGDLSQELYAVFSLHGTATPGKDYQDPGRYVRFAPGESEVSVNVVPIADDIAEPMETVALRLEDSTAISSLPVPPVPYQIEPQSGSAAVVIFDRTRPEGGAIEFGLPDSGTVYPQSATISMLVTAYHPTAALTRVDFFADGQLIGTSQLILNELILGGFLTHRFDWKGAAPGQHILTAVTTTPDGTTLQTSKIPITVQPVQSEVVVLNVTAEDPEAAEPNANGVLDPAVFRFTRAAGPKDVDVTIYYQLSGAAQNGIDYAALDGKVVLPAGETSVAVIVKPLADQLQEGDESVLITLEPVICPAIYPTPPWCYQIGSPDSAKAVIHDATPGQPPVTVTLLSPQNGAVFNLGDPITFTATAQTLGIVPPAELDIVADEQVLESNKDSKLTFTRNNLALGAHVIVARLVDASGKQYTSDPVKILVRGVDTMVFVRRQLPAGYIPGTALVVTLDAQPPAGTSAYALEDMPPKDWAVSSVSDGGAFDPVTGKVKFGLFTDNTGRTLTYMVTPPSNAAGSYQFSGSSSLNGVLIPIGGDSSISLSGGTHPADLNPADQAISLNELTAYGAAWKTGASWSAGPVPIPLEYVTRAGLIWKNGEKYVYDPTQGAPPFCWIPLAPKPQVRMAVQSGGTAERVVQPANSNPQAFVVQVKVSPGLSVASYAVQEQLPGGWMATSVSEDGFFDTKANCIRWGLFLDGTARVLTYVALPAPGSSGAALQGWVSFDGSRDPVRASEAGTSGGAGYGVAQLSGIARGADGAMHLNLRGPAGVICTLQSSADLKEWTDLVPVFLPDGQLEYPASATNAPIRFYRTR